MQVVDRPAPLVWRMLRIPEHVLNRLLNFSAPGETRGGTISRLLDHDATCPTAKIERLQRLARQQAGASDPRR